jgi:hypothetical protein
MHDGVWTSQYVRIHLEVLPYNVITTGKSQVMPYSPKNRVSESSFLAAVGDGKGPFDAEICVRIYSCIP